MKNSMKVGDEICMSNNKWAIVSAIVDGIGYATDEDGEEYDFPVARYGWTGDNFNSVKGYTVAQ